MNNNPIYLTREDHAKLHLLLATTPNSSRAGSLAMLRAELDRALVVDPSGIPRNVVTMGASVEIEDLETGESEVYTLAFPERADVEKRMLSILAPIGTAIIGNREGEEVHWATPGGVRRIRIGRVIQASAPVAVAATSASDPWLDPATR